MRQFCGESRWLRPDFLVPCKNLDSRNLSSFALISVNLSQTGFKGGATFSAPSLALISCIISKHSSINPTKIACPAGTLVPPGPKNFPSTREESILRSSSTRGLMSFFSTFSWAARAPTWRRMWTRRWWMGTSSTERTERDLRRVWRSRSGASEYRFSATMCREIFAAGTHHNPPTSSTSA